MTSLRLFTVAVVFFLSPAPFPSSASNHVRRLESCLAFTIGGQVIAAAQRALGVAHVVFVRVGQSATTAYPVLRIWAHVHSVADVPALVTHIDLLPMQGALHQSVSVADVVRDLVAREGDHYGHRLPDPVRLQRRRVVLVHYQFLNFIGRVLQRDAAYHPFYGPSRGGLIGAHRVGRAAYVDALHGGVLVRSFPHRRAHDYNVLLVVQADDIVSCFSGADLRCRRDGSANFGPGYFAHSESAARPHYNLRVVARQVWQPRALQQLALVDSFLRPLT